MGEEPRAGAWRTVPDILVAAARHRPDVAMLMGVDGTGLTAQRLLEHCRRGAWLLSRRGVRRGAFVVVDAAAMSWLDTATAYLAVTWLGATAVLTTSDSMQRHAVERMGAVAAVSTLSCPAAGTVVSPAGFADAAGRVDEPAAEPDDWLDVVFTSGTTGAPKPVASTHRQWTRSVRPELMASRDRRLVAHASIPVAVSGGLHGVLLNHLARGVTSLPTRSVPELLDACGRHPVTELHLTPHAAAGLVRSMSAGEWAGRVRVIRIVGGPVPPAVATALAACFPRARVVSLYALTEGGAAAFVRLLNRDDHESIGRPAPGTEVRVVDAEGRQVPAGQVGELAVRVAGAGAPRYLGDESLNAEWFQDGWARTGDLGFVADSGEIRLVGRSKELIFLRGGRVAPEQVERLLSAVVPAAVDFVVAGVRGTEGWERIAVFLDGTAAASEVAEAQRRLAGMRGPFRPQVVHVVDQIPRGPFGKPLRRVLLAGLGAQP